jgi:hypothetical protein
VSGPGREVQDRGQHQEVLNRQVVQRSSGIDKY